ncbi:MAG: class I SAM-dependent methyltransferase [Caldilineales bacterium]|nr:class I SAM-dependent methyltransferase [Caldilineales bacterium]MCW5856765.1 class I SAM-dependent methyltransferase [Caldilineales bacterium]
MESVIRKQLEQINHDFYTRHAAGFAATRFGGQPGWSRIIAHFPPVCQVLDLGCGNGRFARFLDQHLQQVRYLGLDASASLIDIARRETAGLAHTQAEFRPADLSGAGWEEAAGGGWDTVVCLAALHHIPGLAHRSAFVSAAARLLAPAGVLILSTWRFRHSARMARKILPWATVGLASAQLEPGDYLLDWRQDGVGHRYVHEVDEAEIAALAAQAGLSVIEQFHADGREGDLSLYAVLRV